MKLRCVLGACLALTILCVPAAASVDVATIIAQVICGLVPEIITLAQAIAALVFIYGGAKYAFSADDPGGRKQGKSIAINGLIGMLIVATSRALVQAIAGTAVC